MKQYIDKAAIMAEIKRKIRNIDYEGLSDRNIGQKQSLYHILSFLNTLEVKEVDLEKEFDKCCEDYIFDDEWDVYIAKHFFKLGLKLNKIIWLK